MKEFLENKTVKFVLGIIAVVSAIMFIRKIFFRSAEEKNIDKAKNSRADTYKKIKPSFAEHIYFELADILEMALARGTTEDEEAVYSVFNQVKNISDVYKIIDAYGSRTMLMRRHGSTLPATIAETFSVKEKKKLNAILATKGIYYTFH